MATDDAVKKQPKSFEALTPELSMWILDFAKSSGFARTTPVQAMAIPLLMGNKDLVVEAVTGSGKTLSFLIPIVERLLRLEEPNKKGYIRSIVVAPTKELASQIYDVMRALLDFHQPSAAYLRTKQGNSADALMSDDEDAEPPPPLPSGPYVIPQLLIGGRMKLQEDLAAFSDLNPNVLIATPKRLMEVLQSSRVQLKRHWFDLLVLDEADRLLDPNFQADLQQILDMVPKERRTGLFSASVSEAVNELVRVGMRYPFKISAKVRSKSGALDKRTPESLRLCYVTCKASHKLPTLKRILEQSGAQKAIVYVSTRAGVDYWDRILPSLLNVSVYPMHGDHKADIRAKNLQRFRDASEPAILLTTDVLARGIDISDVDLVVQLDLPSQPKDFIHRCGRSGRAGKRGMAITIFDESNAEDYMKYLDVQGTKLEPYAPSITISDGEAEAMTSKIREAVMRKRELYDRAQKAFVSWVQAYSKTLPADFFSIKKIDWADVGKAWGLLRWPKMPELKRNLPEAVKDRTLGLEMSEGFDLEALAYANPAKEAKRLALNASYASGEHSSAGKHGGAAADLRRRGERAWSAKKDAKALREGRREKNEVRRGKERSGKMTETERVEEMELQEMIRAVRERTMRAEQSEGDAGFEGFGD
nr:hypothetical protein B0A51_16020 [Rachicladosporium sp. CCFEE 5018]